MQCSHDILIVGGGLVGSVLAIALQQSQFDVAWVEPTPLTQLPLAFDQRLFALAKASVNALQRLGVLTASSRTRAISRIHVSRTGDFGFVVLNASDYGLGEFGRTIAGHDLGDALRHRHQQRSSVTSYRQWSCQAIDPARSAWRDMTLMNPAGQRCCVRAKLIVACDGTRSTVRTLAGIGVNVFDYRRSVLVTQVVPARLPDGMAWERLSDFGPVALLPRADRHFGMICAAPPATAQSLQMSDPPTQLAWLQQAFGWRAGRFVDCRQPQIYPLSRHIAQSCIAERVVLLGNAAQTIAPVGAQGFNLGLRDALTLAECLDSARTDPGAADLLRTYDDRRRRDRQQTIAFSHALLQLTQSQGRVLRLLRSLGLWTLSQRRSWQAWVVGGAMGVGDEMPALCGGEG